MISRLDIMAFGAAVQQQHTYNPASFRALSFLALLLALLEMVSFWTCPGDRMVLRKAKGTSWEPSHGHKLSRRSVCEFEIVRNFCDCACECLKMGASFQAHSRLDGNQLWGCGHTRSVGSSLFRRDILIYCLFRLRSSLFRSRSALQAHFD